MKRSNLDPHEAARTIGNIIRELRDRQLEEKWGYVLRSWYSLMGPKAHGETTRKKYDGKEEFWTPPSQRTASLETKFFHGGIEKLLEIIDDDYEDYVGDVDIRKLVKLIKNFKNLVGSVNY